MKHKLILGTVQFGLDYGINNYIGKVSSATVKEILDVAYQNNVSLLDSAESYGDSHEKIGNYHRESSNSFQVITKFSSARLDLPKNIIDRVNKNLKTLNIKSLYSYMFHSYSDYKKYYPIFKKDLEFLRKKKYIKKIGVSLYTNKEFEDVLKNNDLDLIQIPFNLFENSNRKKDVILKAKSKGFEIHVRSIFLQGLFFKKIDSIKGKLLPFKPQLEQLEFIKTKYRISTEILALQYVLQKQYIDNVLIGIDSVDQLINNIKISSKKIKIPFEEIDKINVRNKRLLNPVNWI
jgi:aryl-alcohol dehydrogenase-like predicted oxidoreductase